MSEAYGATGFSIEADWQSTAEPSGLSSPAPLCWRRENKEDEINAELLLVEIGREVRSLRLHHGMDLAELAAAAGISVSMLSRVENGRISPSLSTLHALSSALGRPLVALFRGFEKQSRAVFIKAGSSDERSGHGGGVQHKLLSQSAPSLAAW